METKFLKLFIVIVFSQVIVGCNLKKPPNIIKQELLYNYSETDKKFEVSLKTTLEFDKKIKNDKYFMVFGNDKIELIPNSKINNEIEYVSYFKTKETIYGDSTFINKIKYSPIINTENEKVSKSKDYKLDIRTTLWIGNDRENPYINFK